MYLNGNFVYLFNRNLFKPTIMKKNILGAAVIFFVTLAFLLMLDDITSNGNHEPQQNNVEVYDTNEQPDIATLDEE